jgi:hypothetical protein
MTNHRYQRIVIVYQ